MSDLTLGIWCHLDRDFLGGADETAREMDRLADIGVDILLAYVTPEEGTFYYDSTIPGVKSEDRLSVVLPLAKERGIRLHPWVFPSSWVDRSPPKAGVDGAYVSGQPGGNKQEGVYCGSWAPAQKPGVAMANDMLDHHDLEGLHLDVVRYREVGECLSWPCRCAACSRLYREYIGKDTLTADDLKVPGILFKFMQLRQDQIRSVVDEMKTLADQRAVTLSAAVRVDYFNWALLEGQDWVQWARDGLFDSMYTMNYFLDRDLHRQWVKTHIALAGDHVPLYHGIGRKSSFGEMDTRQMMQQVDDALQLGARGLCIFHLNPMRGEDFDALRSLKR